jgi:hypothetical protein
MLLMTIFLSPCRDKTGMTRLARGTPDDRIGTNPASAGRTAAVAHNMAESGGFGKSQGLAAAAPPGTMAQMGFRAMTRRQSGRFSSSHLTACSALGKPPSIPQTAAARAE